jgi:hypothetical protein
MKCFALILVAIMSVGCGLFGGYSAGYGGGYYPSASAYGMPPIGAGYGYGGGGYIAPPSPANLAFVNGNGFPFTWRGTPHDVRVVNNTEAYVRIRLDGVDMNVAEQNVPMPPLIPAGQEAHFYAPLAQTDLRSGCEHHHVEFELYLPPNFQQPVQRTGRDTVFCFGWRGGQEIDVRE